MRAHVTNDSTAVIGRGGSSGITNRPLRLVRKSRDVAIPLVMLLALMTSLLPPPAAATAHGVSSCLPLGPAVARAAERDHSDVAWATDLVLVADVNCDGTEDYSIGGMADSTFYVGVVIGPLSDASEVFTLDFPFAPSAQDGLGGWPATLHPERLYDPTEAVGAVEGLEPSDTCHGLEIMAGGIDPFHIYWNHKTKRLDWWRL